MNKSYGEIYEAAKAVLTGEKEFEETCGIWQGYSARCVELPWLMHQLRGISHRNILDIGFSLAALDYLRILLDLRKEEGVALQAIDIVDPKRVFERYPEEWHHEIRQVPVIVEDIRTARLPIDQFDTVLCISMIEHIGYDKAAGMDSKSAFVRTAKPEDVNLVRSDRVEEIVLAQIRKALKRGGHLLLTVPAGKGGVVLLKDSLGLYCAQFEYNRESWQRIARAEGFECLDQGFFSLEDNNTWKKVESITSLAGSEAFQYSHSRGCAAIMLRKI